MERRRLQQAVSPESAHSKEGRPSGRPTKSPVQVGGLPDISLCRRTITDSQPTLHQPRARRAPPDWFPLFFLYFIIIFPYDYLFFPPFLYLLRSLAQRTALMRRAWWVSPLVQSGVSSRAAGSFGIQHCCGRRTSQTVAP